MWDTCSASSDVEQVTEQAMAPSGSHTSGVQQRRMSRQLKELRSLMPWTWDARIDEHPAGESSLRDFKDVYSWTGDGKGRRAGGNHHNALPTPPPRKCLRKVKAFVGVECDGCCRSSGL